MVALCRIRSLAGLVLSLAFLVLGCQCQSFRTTPTTAGQLEKAGTLGAAPEHRKHLLDAAAAFKLDPTAAHRAAEVMAAGPHPFGSAAQAQRAHWLQTQVSSMGLRPVIQEFAAAVPRPLPQTLGAPSQHAPPLTTQRKGRNLWAQAGLVKDASCLVIVASHYDSKDMGEFAYHGANDGASSSLLLLQLLPYLQAWQANHQALPQLHCDIAALWFDGEEPVLANWDDGLRLHPARLIDNTYGSRHFVDSLAACRYAQDPAWCLPASEQTPPQPGPAVVSLVLLDMIGSPQLRLSNDTLSSAALRQELNVAAQALGLSQHLDPTPLAISDDHLPFRRAGIAAIDLIDFNDLKHWHQASDLPATLSLPSIEKAGKLALYLVLSAASQPKAFFLPADNPS